MTFTPLPFDAPLPRYRDQAAELLAAWRSGDADAIQFVRHTHPRFLTPEVPWLPSRMSEEEVRATPFDEADAQLATARAYDFADWPSLVELASALADQASPTYRFEAAVEAVIHGDTATLEARLREHPELAHARSTRVTHFDSALHRATLLHYVAANGVEGHRQRTPPEAVAVARMLLEAGADPDALADMYGGRCTTMSMLVSSAHPAEAGLQVPLIDVLVDHGASVEAVGAGDWTSLLMTALAFGFVLAAEALVRRGARVDGLAAAAGLGRLEDARRMLDGASGEDRHRALALAAQQGHVEVVRMLLDAGENPDRYNPRGNHAHATPLHQAVWAGRSDVVRLLVERGARLDITDKIYESTPLGWAVYGGKTDLAEYLRARGQTQGP